MARFLRHAYGAIPSPADNDGIVPTRSQAWGHVFHAAVADHLDVLGYFRDASYDPPHVDWLVSGSGFNRAQFEALWDDVSRFLVCADSSTGVSVERNAYGGGGRIAPTGVTPPPRNGSRHGADARKRVGDLRPRT